MASPWISVRVATVSFVLTVLFIPIFWGQNSLMITSPANGTTVSLGQALTVKFHADANVSNPLLICDFAGCISATPSAPGEFSITIPTSSAIRSYTLNLLGVANGQIASAAPVTINVDTPLSVTSVTTSPGTLHFDQASDVLPLHVIGTLSDGSTADVTHSPQISYASSDASVLTVDNQGNVTAVGAGKAFVSVTSASGTYAVYSVVTGAQAATPAFSSAAGTYTSVQTVTISDTTPGSTIYYTTNGISPTANSAQYTAPISVDATETLKAMAVASGYSQSPEASANYVINLPPPDFSIAVNPSALALKSGQNGTLTISLNPVNSFNQTTSFSCSGLPSDATCSFAPSTLAPSGAPATTTLTLTTTGLTKLALNRSPVQFAGITSALIFCLGGGRRRRLGLKNYALGLLWVSAALLASGCAGGYKKTTSTVTVTATAGILTHSTTFTLNMN